MAWVPTGGIGKVDLEQETPPLPERAETLVSEHDNPDPSFWDTTVAALQRENMIGSVMTSKATKLFAGGEYDHIEEGYNPYDDPDLKGYTDNPDYERRFITAHNKKVADAVRTDIDREQKNDRTIDAAGWPGFLMSMGAAVVDPTILLPGGAMVKGGRLGYSALKTGVRVGAATGVAVGIQEAGLQASQQTRPLAESALNIGGSVILGGLLGAGAARFFSRSERKALTKAIEADLVDETPNPGEIAETIVQRMQSVGASSVDEIKLDDLGIGGGRAAQAVANATNAIKLNPGVATMMSPSVKVREIYAKMVDNPIYTKMNMEGKSLGADVENRVKYWERGQYSAWLTEARDLHLQSRRAGENIKYDEFMERVGRAMRRSDFDPDSEFVSKAAKAGRDTLSDPLLKEAQEMTLLPKDIQVETAPSYFHRLWNRKRLQAREFEFKTITRSWLGRAFDAAAAENPEASVKFLNEQDKDAYIEEIAESIFDNLTGKGGEDIPEWLVPAARGPLKDRTFRIPDNLVEDFLESDAEIVLRRYARIMGAETELARKFGTPDMKDQIKEIRQDYQELRKKVEADKRLKPDTREAKLQKLQTDEKRDVTNIEAFRDMLRGTYRAKEEASNWGALTRGLLAWNYMRLLGGVTLTSMADMSRLVGVHGLRATMREGLPSLVSTLRRTNLAVNEAKELGAVTETLLNSRLASLAEINDPYAFGSTYERMLSNAARAFTKFTGITYWNDTMKGIVSVMTQNRVLRNAQVGDFAKLDQYERAYMGYLGIDEDMAGRVAKQYAEHGEKQGVAFVANSHLWTDPQARRAYAAALTKDVDRTIVTKGVADQPLWTRTNWGRLIMQFKSFALASHQRVLIAGLQERPHRFAEMLVGATALGMMIAWVKHIERGDTEKANALLDNPGLWITDGLDRTGILSVPFELSNTAEKLGYPIGAKSGLQAAFGDDRRDLDVSRYASRGPIGAIGGPTVGLLEDLNTFATQMAKGDLKRSGVNAAIRQLPFGSLPGVKSGLYLGARPAIQELVE